MVCEIMHDEAFLTQKAEPATPEDLPVAQDLLDTLAAHKDSCVGMAANMIGVNKHIVILSDTHGKLNVEQLSAMDLRRRLTPAIVSYEGIQYQYMAPAVTETAQLDYLREHLRILSAFYSLLRPFDGVTPY